MVSPLLRILTPCVILLPACGKAPDSAKPEFSDAVVYLLQNFEGEEVDIAFAMNELEAQIYTSMDVEAKNANDRALTPARIDSSVVEELEHPDRDPNLALPVAVAGISRFAPDDHKHIQMLTDHTPVEPYSPEKYERTFLEGEDCWLNRDCPIMRTEQDLIKENLLMTIPYSFPKDFRWINLNISDPDSSPRWAYMMRAWNREKFSGESDKNHILQSFSVEVIIPRDGYGFIRTAETVNRDEGEWTADSDGEGLLQMLSIWAETDLGGIEVSDDTIAATTRNGIDKNFKAAADWLEENRP